jgi:NitT/TauT family transport system substrate-binding protein
LLAAVICLVCLAGCSSPSGEQDENRKVAQQGGDGGRKALVAGPSGAEKWKQVRIVYRLKWLYNASTLGDLWAERKGLFEAAGLRVEIREGGAEHDAIKEIELGRAMFGVASADQVIRAVAKGADVVVLAQIFQKNPLQWIYIKERTDFDPEDPVPALKHYTFGITYGGNDEAIFTALSRRFGLDPEGLKTYAITYDYSPFWQGRVEFWPVYRNTQGIVLERRIAAQGQHAGFLDPTRYGIDFVANSLVTSSKAVARYPGLVARFTAVLMSAWKEALLPENRQEAQAILMGVEPGLDEASAQAQIEETARMVWPDMPGGAPGIIDRAAWRQSLEIMLGQHLIDKRIALDRLFWQQPVPAGS